ncbi:MAG TPA: acireductone synthase [Blastocatellia bacterium]|jgi:enolase-phosphatase E1|nr:acireductone synthase [Blastocatellia bacterium]
MKPFAKPVSVLLLDIEGTTTPIDFVYNILFPYAREHVKPYLEARSASTEVQTDIRELLQENSDDVRRELDPPLINGPAERVSPDEVVAYVHWLMERDRKTTPLKSLQGKIWDEGYRRGELRSQVFEDVPRAFKRWREQARKIFIYSSGSVLAQKLLFANTEAGDLTPFISGYFDTNIGAKKDPESYRGIASELELQSLAVLFVSDVTAELDAAATAGCETLLCVRPGNHPQSPAASHTIINTFDEIFP